MLLHRISLRQMSAVGAAALVAGGLFTVSAFADTENLDPGQATSAATLPEAEETPVEADPQDEFFASPSPEDERDREDRREEAREQAGAAVDDSSRTGSGTGSEIQEPEPEPESTPEASSGSEGSSSSSGGSVPSGSAKEIALQMVLDEGWGAEEFNGCLEPLWEKESNWNHTAENASSGAYGIPQSLPGSKMASHGDDWQTNPATQIAWGLDYIKDRYGTPCGAWSHSQANNWY
ncbi:lytic transglycosylase domain-containing protein [Nocardiopsis sp. JB363]|uniref:aggregation-promoting factor C-terminal-like domain-containing protein n=1 Tax=Nocardiopsis sp. JB363 TaxID=1434837 RepID=UPI00097A83E0|nr:lytic transglycosylase domain-containing protein [Nocardiopsis sp. JB363]SIO84239.1 Secreted protein precursor [Nocardiopsis sp. JB363]